MGAHRVLVKLILNFFKEFKCLKRFSIDNTLPGVIGADKFQQFCS